jgi:hypothetical protein
MKVQPLWLFALLTFLPIALHAQDLDAHNSIFQVVPTPNHGINNMLFASSASSPTDIWAVGYTTMHFDGNHWKAFQAPGFSGIPFRGILDFSPTFAWAGGGFDSQGQVIDQWNGTKWERLQNTPFPASWDPWVMTISGTSPTDIWVTGQITVQPNQDINYFFEHWNGKSWGNLSYLSGSVAYFYSATQDAPNDAWVVGVQWVGYSELPLIIHYSGGNSWVVADLPLPQGIAYGIIYGVTALSPKDVWAVGVQNSGTPDNATNTTLVYHFDGNAWSIVPSPTTPGINLGGIVANSPKDLYAFGFDTPNNLGFDTLVLHWDGNGWTTIPSPNPDEHKYGWYDELWTGVVPSPGNIWIFGTQTEKTLALHTTKGD